MSDDKSFIEVQFPVSKISKESYKERKANNGQTLTGLGKWWGRKPLVLVRAAIIGCLLPVSDNPAKDMEMFCRIMTIDEAGLLRRKEKKIPVEELFRIVQGNQNLKRRYEGYFETASNKIILKKDSPRGEIEQVVFDNLPYDLKLNYCIRPEQLNNNPSVWEDINNYYGTSAKCIQEFVEQLSIKRYGHILKVGDCFCGGGSIPYEAGRIGSEIYASDLNPVAGLLTWSALNISGAKQEELTEITGFQDRIYSLVRNKILQLGIDTNESGDIAVSYLYCLETKCPECGQIVPIAPSWIIGKGTKTIAKIVKEGTHYAFDVKMNASKAEMLEADSTGTFTNDGLKCPCCGKTTPMSSIRHDWIDDDNNKIYGLIGWKKDKFMASPDDVFHERLYAIKYEHTEIDENGKQVKSRYYRAPNEYDLKNEDRVRELLSDVFTEWQEKGYIPSGKIESGNKTDEVIRTRGWNYWHQLFNARQLYLIGSFVEKIAEYGNSQRELAAGLLGVHRLNNFNSKLSRFNSGSGVEKVVDVFFNQALNPLYNYGCLGIESVYSCWKYNINNYEIKTKKQVSLADARNVKEVVDYWITDPPYADAVLYHELAEFFLAWDKDLLPKCFPDWYTDSKRILAVRGDDDFSQTMIEIYQNLTKHMDKNGIQIVMFTHSDPAVWAQLAIIMWRAGLKVTAAWNIATETDASGLKNGNFVKGTVLLVLRKQTGDDMAFLDEINSDIKSEVKSQIDSMQKLDDKEEPNFSDPDYVLAAYAASLKVLTAYAEIEDLDLDYELNQAIKNPAGSKIVAIIENAKKIAYDCVIPTEIDSYMWRDLTNAEKFFIKGLESEKRGDYSISTYQEFARGFSIGGYSQLMANEKANSARLKTPFEMASRSMNDVPDFESSLTRIIFTGIYVGIKEDMNPSRGLDYIKNELPNYWDKREMIQQILSFLVNIKDISNMQPHWTSSAELAEQLLTLVSHDSI